MKITRYKRAQRYLSFYRNNFDFRPPYQIILDGTFCQAALKNKVNISDQMPKYLNDQVKLLTTVCVVNEAEKLSKSIYGAMLVIKQFPVHKCGHEKNPVSANDCLFSFLKNSKGKHYFLATQDPSLTERIRQLAYVPLIYIKMSTIVLEKPQDFSQKIANQSQEATLKIDEHQLETLKKLKTIEFGEESKEPKKKKKKGPKEPNPLSCKKKKKKDSKSVNNNNKTESKQEQAKKRRKRNNRIPNHIKRMFNKIESELNNVNNASTSTS